MKKLLTIILLISISAVFAQKRDYKDKRKFGRKFEELEKLKLLEMLDLEEEIAIKFFARRNLMKKSFYEIMEESSELFDKIEMLIKSDEETKDFVPLISKYKNVDEKIMKERLAFISSLDDILTNEQIAKVILFERKFKRDVRDLLIKSGRKDFRKNKEKN